MKKILIFFILLTLIPIKSFSQSRFGELTEMRDEKMRGKDGQWVRPHPGPFIWNHIEFLTSYRYMEHTFSFHVTVFCQY